MSSRRHGQSGNWPKVLQNVRKASEREGWTWDLKGSGHWTVRNPDGEFVVAMGGTMYDGTLVKRLLSKLRKAGCPGA